MKEVRFGIIGLGNQGSYYCFELFDRGLIKGGVITAMCDINPAKIERVKARTLACDAAMFTDYIALLDSGLVDAVLIETPHYLHPEIAIEALSRGIHVVCEKPAGVYTKQVRRMNEVAEESGAMFTVMFNQRTNCIYRKMRELIAAGEIGRLQHLSWIITDWYRTQHYYDTGSWRATWAGEGGGVLINQCPHQLDLMQWIVGEMPQKVRAFCQYGKWHDIEVEDDVTAYFEYGCGATGVFITTTGVSPGTNRLEISGTRGKLLAEGDKLLLYRNSEDSLEFSGKVKESFVRPSFVFEEVMTDGLNPQHAGIINNFIAAICNKEPLFVDGREGIHGVELMNAIELSGWLNETVSLPIDEEFYLKVLREHAENSVVKRGCDDLVSDTAGSFGGRK